MTDRRPLPSRRRFLRTALAGSVAAGAMLWLPSTDAAYAEEPVPTNGEGDLIPLSVPDDLYAGEHWVDVNLTEQAAVGMVGQEPVYVALATTGQPGWETPEGQFRIVRRVANETMTSAALGITNPADYYNLTDVLFTQYFTWEGHALHLNYWRPDSVFGNIATSHGCVGLRYNDASFFWRHVGIGSRVVIHA